MAFWNQKTFCVITGSSRGIGKSIAIEFSKKVGPNSVFLLLDRLEAELENTKNEVLCSGNSPIHVSTAVIDLRRPNAANYLNLINETLIASGNEASDFDHYLLVHNAATTGMEGLKAKMSQMEDLVQLHEYYDLNLFSLILLTSQFLKVFSDPVKQRSIIQISSIGAIYPIKGSSLYSVGKIARDMVMRSIAAEDPSISTMSYAPGVVNTEMLRYLTKQSIFEDVRIGMEQVAQTDELQSPFQTVSILIGILGEEKFVKGEHVDYTGAEAVTRYVSAN